MIVDVVEGTLAFGIDDYTRTIAESSAIGALVVSTRASPGVCER